LSSQDLEVAQRGGQASVNLVHGAEGGWAGLEHGWKTKVGLTNAIVLHIGFNRLALMRRNCCDVVHGGRIVGRMLHAAPW
jgi:hypothetical protein